MNRKYIIPVLFVSAVLFGLILFVGHNSMASAAPSQSDPTPTPTPQYYLGDTHSAPLDQYLDWWIYSSVCWQTQDAQQAVLSKTTSTGWGTVMSPHYSGYCSYDSASSVDSSTELSMTQYKCFHDTGNEAACTFACAAVGGCAQVISGWGSVNKSAGVNTAWGWKSHPDSDYSGDLMVIPVYYGIAPPCEQPDPMDLPPLEASRLSGTDILGHHFDLLEGKDYYLVLTDEDAWNDGADDRYDAAVSWDGGDTWEQVAAGNGPLEDPCAADPGPDETMVMFTADEDHLSMDLRVNDGPDDLDFADNSGYLHYKLSVDDLKSGETGCGVYYSSGDLIVNYTEDPSSSFSSEILFDNQDIYRFVVPHTWQDGSQYQSALQIKESSFGSWTNFADYPQTVCVEDHDPDKSTEDGWVTYYLRAPKDQTWYDLRSLDLTGSYGDNSGSMDIDVYSSSYDPGSSPCAAQYDVLNTFEGVVVFATQENGYKIPNNLDNPNTTTHEGFTVGQYYMFEEVLSWEGWQDAAGVNKFEWQISTDRLNWYDIDTWADCVEQTSIDHHNYYFQADAETYYVRVKDSAGNFGNNSGTLKFNIAAVADLTSEPDTPEGSCPNYTLDETVVDAGFSASLNQSYIPDVIDPGHLIALELEPPAWTDDGVETKTADLRLDKTSFEDLASWSGALCTEYDAEGYPRVYMMSQDDQMIMRADDTPDNNAGSVNYTIQYASWIEDPKSGSCEIDYNPLTFADYPPDNPVIKATKSDGVLVKDYKLRAGTYKIKIFGGPWKETTLEGMDERYDVEISLHNGAENSWFDLSDAADCYVPIVNSEGEQIGARAYIEIAESKTHYVKLRVNNEDGLWIDNSGSMQFSMMYDVNSADPDDPDNPYDDPYEDPDQPFQQGGCDLQCVVPSSSLNVPAWLEYFRCQLVRRLSFCNYHWAVIRHMRQLFVIREPFGSINEFAQAMGLVRQQVEGYAWAEGGGDAPRVDTPSNFIFATEGGGAGIPLVGPNTPWGDGEINILGSGATVSTECTNNMADALGSRLARPICFGFNVLDSLGLRSWFQLFWDLVMIVSLATYFQNRWISKMQG